MNQAPVQSLCIAKTLAWEFWASGWRGILLMTLGAMVLPGVILTAIQWQTHGPGPLRVAGRGMQFGCFWTTVLLCGFPVLQAVGNPRLRYTLPISGFVLVGPTMACAMLTVFVQYSTVAWALNLAFDAGWSVWGPALLAAVCIAWIQAMLWSTWNSPGLQFMACMGSFLILMSAIARWTPPNSPAMDRFLSGFDGWRLGLFGFATLSSFAVGVGGFAKLRHGSEIDVKRFADWLRGLRPFGRRTRVASFTSPQSAQFWLEWKRGAVLPVGFASIAFGVVLLALYAPTIAPAHFDGQGFITGASLFFLLPLGVMSLYWGMRSPKGEFGAFDGSRPLSDGQLSHAVLKSATLGLMASLLIWIVSMALVVWIVGDRPELSQPYQRLRQIGPGGIIAILTLSALAAWSAVCLLTSVVLTGTRLFPAVIGLAFGVALAGVLLPLCFPQDSRRDVQQAYWLVWLAVCLFGCGAAFVQSWRLRLISQSTLALAAVLIVASGSTAIAAAHFAGLPLDWKSLIVVACCCALLPIPLAAAPLAIYVNRHR